MVLVEKDMKKSKRGGLLEGFTHNSSDRCGVFLSKSRGGPVYDDRRLNSTLID